MGNIKTFHENDNIMFAKLEVCYLQYLVSEMVKLIKFMVAVIELLCTVSEENTLSAILTSEIRDCQ